MDEFMITDDFTEANPEFHRTLPYPRLPPPCMVHGQIVFQHKADPVKTLDAIEALMNGFKRK